MSFFPSHPSFRFPENFGPSSVLLPAFFVSVLVKLGPHIQHGTLVLVHRKRRQRRKISSGSHLIPRSLRGGTGLRYISHWRRCPSSPGSAPPRAQQASPGHPCCLSALSSLASSTPTCLHLKKNSLPSIISPLIRPCHLHRREPWTNCAHCVLPYQPVLESCRHLPRRLPAALLSSRARMKLMNAYIPSYRV